MDDSQVGAENIKNFHVPTWIKTNKNTKENNIGLTTVDIFLDGILKESYFYNIPAQCLHWVLAVSRGSTPDFKRRGWSNQEKIKTPKKSLDRKINPPPPKKKKMFQKTDITQKIPPKIPT